MKLFGIDFTGIKTDHSLRWRDPTNVYRTNWNVHNVPALVRFELVDGEVSATGKLIEGEILDKAKLSAFLA
jgi:hypothetical protein